MIQVARIFLLAILCASLAAASCAKPAAPPTNAAKAVPPPAAIAETPAGDARPPAAAAERAPSPGDDRTNLRDGWHLVSSAKLKEHGAAIATAGYRDADWYPAKVPSTVLAALVDAGVHPEPYKSDNLRRIPAAEFARSWWYRREFELPKTPGADHVVLGFDGINYRANVWLNGKLVASEKDVRGTFRTYRFDVTGLAVREGKNALAVEVFRPEPGDLAINWWDWVASPPDLNMGLFQDVFVRQTGAVALEDLRLTTKVPSVKKAEVTVTAVVKNATDQSRDVTISVGIGDRVAQKEVAIGARESKIVVFDPGTVPSFSIDNPRLWWPVGLGQPELQTLSGKVSVGGAVSDQRTVRVGLREITSSLAGNARTFSVNGQPIFLRGGGWTSDLLLRRDRARLATELAYTLHLGLNTIRLEGKLDFDEFYDMADELGIVVLPGWMCCDIWEKQKTWNDVHRLVARESMLSQGARLRNHPSVAAFLIGSDKAPQSDVATLYTEALGAVDWPNPIVHAASAEGDSGLKMTGPYDWVPPTYWYEDKTHGGAFGFNSETGPGPAIPELEVMKGFMSARELDELWTQPNAKQFHAGAPGHPFETLRIFDTALRARLGASKNLEDWVKKAQLMNYEAERAEFEAYAARKYAGTSGIVHWLLNNPWPSLIWHLYDWSLVPAASFYGAKKANEPMHAVFAYDDRSVYVVNNTGKTEATSSVAVRVLDLEGNERYSERLAVNVGPDASAKLGAVPVPAGVAGVHFVELELRHGPEVVSTNTYFVPAKKDVTKPLATNWLNTPTVQYADLTPLTKLAPATVKASVAKSKAGAQTQVTVTLENTGKGMAFFVRLLLRRGAAGPLVAPVFWDDNYVTLRPGTKRTLTVSCADAALDGKEPVVELEGMNVARASTP
jgi:exo-1,4-beta-D-glucosaminidase